MQNEPVLIADAVVAVLTVAVLFGLALPVGGQAAIVAAIIAIGAAIKRQRVKPF